MKRSSFRLDGLALSYLDSGGDSAAILALHAHWMEGVTFDSFAEAVSPKWRVIALDQRGHGYSDDVDSSTREDCLRDVESLVDRRLGIERAVLLGFPLVV